MHMQFPIFYYYFYVSVNLAFGPSTTDNLCKLYRLIGGYKVPISSSLIFELSSPHIGVPLSTALACSCSSMASSLRFLVLVSLVAVIFSSIEVEARSSMMFSRIFSGGATEKKNEANAETTKNSEAQMPEAENGYGLYAQNVEYRPNKHYPNTYPVKGEGMSDTSTMEDGKYSYDVSYAEKEKENSQGASNGNGEENEQRSNENAYQSKGEGMSDTRSMENGKYFYDVSNINLGESRRPELANTESQSQFSDKDSFQYQVADHGNAEENYHQTNENTFQMKGEGMSDTRSLENGKYYFDVSNINNLGESEHPEKMNLYSQKQYENADSQKPYQNTESQKPYQNAESQKQYENPNGERYVFDTMEEYEKYLENRRYKP